MTDITMDLKNELVKVPVLKGVLRSVEVATALRLVGGLHRISNKIVIEMEFDNLAVLERIKKNCKDIFGIESTVISPLSSSIQNGIYILRISQGGEILARQTGIIDQAGRLIKGFPSAIVNNNRETTMTVWRTALMVKGFLGDPTRHSSLEVIKLNPETAMALVGGIKRLGIASKAKEVRNVSRVVIRDTEAVVNTLQMLQATETATNWAKNRKFKIDYADANRLVNFDDANLRRSALAAVAAGARVERALLILGDKAPEHLKYAGKLRIEHKQATLDELGQLAKPAMTKDAIAGRIRRLLSLADKHAIKMNIPTTDAVVSDNFAKASNT